MPHTNGAGPVLLSVNDLETELSHETCSASIVVVPVKVLSLAEVDFCGNLYTRGDVPK